MVAVTRARIDLCIYADGRSSGQQSGVKHGGAMQQNKYAGQTGSYGGGWA
jgi:hypothetical protein